MESKPLIVVISSKALSKKKALKSINSFLETNEAANIESTDSDKCDAVPEDIVNKLTIMKSFMEPEHVKFVPSSSSQAEAKESNNVIKSAKKSPKKDQNLTEKKRKSAPMLDEEIATDHKSKKKKHSTS
jgi:hypothetical protein